MLELINKGLSREEAYKLAQENAHRAWNTSGGNFKENLLNDEKIKKHLNEAEIQDCFDPNYYLRNIHIIYERLEI